MDPLFAEKSHSLAEGCSNDDDVITPCLYPIIKIPRILMKIRLCPILGDSFRWTGFLVISRSMEALLFVP